MAEWLGIGLQNRAQQFDSAWYLKEGARWKHMLSARRFGSDNCYSYKVSN